MASRVQFAVSCTPIYTIAAGNDNAATDVISKDVGKKLGSSGSVTTPGMAAVGWSAGTPTYVIASTGTSFGTTTSIKFAYVRHTGFTSAALTTATTSTLTVIFGGVTVGVIGAGESMLFPFQVATSPVITLTSSSGNIAVEVFATT